MGETAWQAVGLALLFLVVVFAEWSLQRRDHRSGQNRLLRLVTLITIVGGAIGAIAWWQAVPWSFPWLLPPLAFRFLAAAGIAFALLGLTGLLRPSPALDRQFSVLLFVYLAPLTIAIVMFHLDRFDPSRPIVVAFFCAVALLLLGSLAGILQFGLRMSRPDHPGDLLVAGLLAVWGGLLWVWPQGPIPLIWPWASDPLTTRLIAAMFITVAAAHFTANAPQTRSAAQMMTALYGAGIVANSVLNLLQAKPAPTAYLAVWSVITVWSLFRALQR